MENLICLYVTTMLYLVAHKYGLKALMFKNNLNM